MTQVLSFGDVRERTRDVRRHVLLGNGFSRACCNELFAYDALFAQGKKKLTVTARRAFKVLGTTDFESVMRTLQLAAQLVEVYAPAAPDLANRLAADADKLRDVLAEAIASSHPDLPSDISNDEYRACRQFLVEFDNFYTVNYDLLLYWTLMQDEIDDLTIKCDDGFREPQDGPQDYVVWELDDVQGQNVFYLHGALHVFDAGAQIQKYTWSRTGVPLVKQIREALGAGKYPIYVAEGTSDSKLQRIQHSAYLSRGLRSLANITGALVIFGHSLGANDEHILRVIGRGKVSDVYISVYGDPNSVGNLALMSRAGALQEIREQRRPKKPVRVQFFDASSARVWG